MDIKKQKILFKTYCLCTAVNGGGYSFLWRECNSENNTGVRRA